MTVSDARSHVSGTAACDDGERWRAYPFRRRELRWTNAKRSQDYLDVIEGRERVGDLRSSTWITPYSSLWPMLKRTAAVPCFSVSADVLRGSARMRRSHLGLRLVKRYGGWRQLLTLRVDDGARCRSHTYLWGSSSLIKVARVADERKRFVVCRKARKSARRLCRWKREKREIGKAGGEGFYTRRCEGTGGAG